ncbi:hypothetical protein MPTK1_5g05710 [Marchantia polymorpha subsp. ruderalis]|nr:hypothetical protein MARPO_0027s0054 [Marchantia polymorpha]BBN10698.1 hypothetical protein Mp_5g05710 [Marchantia polymorpha subsp. ruderalis]|eukprot:PTQ42934.1 hypothetical protein MARPO_0027s0054 [Marchantia polymorpha]
MGLRRCRAFWVLAVVVAGFSAPGSSLLDFSLGTKGMSFQCDEGGNMWCGGNASTNSEGALTLTPDGRNLPDEYYFNTQGMALYTLPLQLLDNEGRWRSFSCFFRFRIETGKFPGDGLAFVMFNVSRWEGAPGGDLGVYSSSGRQKVKTLAVEFDTFPNKDFDEFSNHVGVDLESLRSKVSRNAYDANINLSGGEDIYTWIDYSVDSSYLEVRIEMRDQRPVQPFLRYQFKLSDVFSDNGTVFAGFSGSNGLCICHNFYTIFDWSLKVIPAGDDSYLYVNSMFFILIGLVFILLLVPLVSILSHVWGRKYYSGQRTGDGFGYRELSLDINEEENKL